MRTKALYSIADPKSKFTARNAIERRAVADYNDVILAEHFWRTEEDILSTSYQFRQKFLTIMAIRNAVAESRRALDNPPNPWQIR